MFSLAFRNIFRQKVRTAMTLAAIVFGVLGLILGGGFIQDMLTQLAETIIHSQSGHIQINRKGFFESGSRSPEKFLIDRPDEVRTTSASLPGIDDQMARISFSGLLNNGKTDKSVLGEGIEPDRETRLGSLLRIIAGRQLTNDDRYGALVGEGIATSLKLEPGSRVTLVANSTEGALNTVELEVVGVFQSFSKEFDASAVRIPLAAAQELLASDGVNTIVVSLQRTSDTDRTVNSLRQLLDPDDYEVRAWYQINDFYEKAVALYERQFSVLILIILVTVLLSVANSVNMSVSERVGEFGTMMAVGNRPGQIFRLIVVENVLLGASGAAVGAALGVLMALAISAVGVPMPPPPNANLGYTAHVAIVPSQIALAFAVGFLATVLASLFPAFRVARIPVVEALRQNV
ncbi:MAG TPA: ABC transporter permease [Candidatus Accumulibacter sp.]|nr:ABC transporter permease [Accumulibacter sp.]